MPEAAVATDLAEPKAAAQETPGAAPEPTAWGSPEIPVEEEPSLAAAMAEPVPVADETEVTDVGAAPPEAALSDAAAELAASQGALPEPAGKPIPVEPMSHLDLPPRRGLGIRAPMSRRPQRRAWHRNSSRARWKNP